ncbi:MAG: c-type cytochrome [Planctomycetia bacterium]|nr:c-type cytochrome [Planctomycetia bacterium]
MVPAFANIRVPDRLRFRSVAILLVAALGGVMLVGSARQAAAQKQSGRVVSDAKYTAPYDAFMKMNRLQEEFTKGQTAGEYWGFLESRLGNQAGRILVKRPAKGFGDDAFRGWLMFVRAYGDATGIGNCTACHTLPDFTDHEKHNIGTAKEPVDTPSLRDLGKKKSFFHDGSAKSLEQAITRHVDNGQIARDNKRAGVEIEVGHIALTEDEVRQVAAFLRSLESVDRAKFREHLVDVVVQPVELEFSE